MSQICRKGVEKQLWKLHEASRGSIKKLWPFQSNEVVVLHLHFCICIFAFAFLHLHFTPASTDSNHPLIRVD